ncbi:uncharacterized protein LOC127625397 [Xyrauchen texanus]|uniref:uncharacterized protein LOC127625397 n=1 Tax=Xyrauchen texanus TaxID=154827 RepID=UPI00224189D5|nr:uncharacterized protein LOC127625397 [Xyrauchen texanus]XP_051956636.1 uncharacterized protein LOC127625397 [Xyrauchen texanus]
MTRVAGVSDDPLSFFHTPPSVYVLEGGKLTSDDVSGSLHHPLQGFAVVGGAIAIPGGDAASQDARYSTSVEPCEDVLVHSKLPQPSQEEEALVSLLHNGLSVDRPCEFFSDVDTEELEAADSLHRCSINGDGAVFSVFLPEVHYKLLGSTDVEGEVVLLTPACQRSLLKSLTQYLSNSYIDACSPLLRCQVNSYYSNIQILKYTDLYNCNLQD